MHGAAPIWLIELFGEIQHMKYLICLLITVTGIFGQAQTINQSKRLYVIRELVPAIRGCGNISAEKLSLTIDVVSDLYQSKEIFSEQALKEKLSARVRIESEQKIQYAALHRLRAFLNDDEYGLISGIIVNRIYYFHIAVNYVPLFESKHAPLSDLQVYRMGTDLAFETRKLREDLNQTATKITAAPATFKTLLDERLLIAAKDYLSADQLLILKERFAEEEVFARNSR